MPGVYKRADKWYYYFNTSKVDGKYKKICRVGGKTKVEAEKALRKAMTEYENTGRSTALSNISVSDYFNFWLDQYVKVNLKHRTYNEYKQIVDSHIIPKFGKHKLNSLDPSTLQEFLNSKKLEGYTKNTVTNFYGVLSGSLKLAVYPYGHLKENPMNYVSMPKFKLNKTDEKIKVLTIEQVNTILDRFPKGSNFFLPVQIAFHTGLRASEVCALTWDNIDLVNRTLKVEKNLLNDEFEWCFDTPKTESSFRTISIGATLIDILKKHIVWQKENKLRYGEYYSKATYKFGKRVYSAIDLLSTKENGELISTNSLKYLSRVVNYDLGIDFNFHALRHTHATLLLENGANMKDVQKRLGHSKLATTMDTYVHVTQKMKNDTVNIFESLVAKK
ncbi:tyrosine-type recombinase/integrase [Clostridium sp. UBA1652]|uniref:tyrosine-type recombinase/integrase n=1 Tax=Clostridium sp. UBA1652 TaxID=1946348 RepID=UPI0025808B19|nr:site-specific integrase [Clostridium sp. UBA1652]